MQYYIINNENRAKYCDPRECSNNNSRTHQNVKNILEEASEVTAEKPVAITSQPLTCKQQNKVTNPEGKSLKLISQKSV